MNLRLVPMYIPLASASQLVIVHSEHAGTVHIMRNMLMLFVVMIGILAMTYLLWDSSNYVTSSMVLLWAMVNLVLLSYHIIITRRRKQKEGNDVIFIYSEEDKQETLRLFITSLVVNILFMYAIHMDDNEEEEDIVEYADL